MYAGLCLPRRKRLARLHGRGGHGGGYNGQANALRLAIARALVKINPDDKKTLRSEGFLTRDARSVERKKPGQPKARRRFQFSKR